MKKEEVFDRSENWDEKCRAAFEIRRAKTLEVLRKKIEAKNQQEQKIKEIETKREETAQALEEDIRSSYANSFREGITAQLLSTKDGIGVNSDFISRLITLYFRHSDNWQDPVFSDILSIFQSKKGIASVTDKEFIEKIQATNKPIVKTAAAPPTASETTTIRESYKKRIEFLRQRARASSDQYNAQIQRQFQSLVQEIQSDFKLLNIRESISQLRLSNEDLMSQDELNDHIKQLKTVLTTLEQTYEKIPSKPLHKRKRKKFSNKKIEKTDSLQWTVSSLYKNIKKYDHHFSTTNEKTIPTPDFHIKKDFFSEDEKNSEWKKQFDIHRKITGTNCMACEEIKISLDIVKVNQFCNNLFETITRLTTTVYKKNFINDEAMISATKLLELARQEIKTFNSQLGLKMYITFTITLPKSIDKLCAFADHATALEKNLEMASQLRLNYY